jgi:hypothetical protein
MHRSKRYLGDGNSEIVVQSWRQGRAHAGQGEREYQIDQQAGFFIDNTRPARITTQCASSFCALLIPRSEFAARIGNLERVAGTNSAAVSATGYWKCICKKYGPTTWQPARPVSCWATI